MNIPDSKLLEFLAGKLAGSESDLFTEQVARDDELAARLSLIAALGGFEFRAAKGVKRPRWGIGRVLTRLTRKSAAVLIGGLLLTSTLSWAAWTIFYEPPLLSDNFNDNWLDVRLWKTGRRPVKEENGYLRVDNRGSIVTVREFAGPITVRLRWRWSDLAGDAAYRDTLTVALRTSGEHDKTHPYQIRDGITITFQSHAGRISTTSRTIRDSPAPGTPEGSFPMPADAWHDIRITDDGEKVAVYIAGPAIDKKYWETPAHVDRFPGEYPKRHIAFYNREMVSEVPHESHIDDVAILKLQKEVTPPPKQ